MRALPLEAKIVKTQLRIREWYEHWDGNVYVSFSGGKDSTVLLHIARGLYPEIPAVFSDTGLEFPEIREFVRATPNVTWVRPDMTFRKVIEKHGYPVISKEQAQWIERARKGDPKVMCEKLYGLRSDGTTTQFCTAAAWRHLINAPFKISAECCNEMKKKPLKRYTAESGRVPIIGTMAAESKLREKNWLKTGCNAYDAKRPVSTPLSFWTENDIWAYIRHYRRSESAADCPHIRRCAPPVPQRWLHRIRAAPAPVHKRIPGFPHEPALRRSNPCPGSCRSNIATRSSRCCAACDSACRSARRPVSH